MPTSKRKDWGSSSSSVSPTKETYSPDLKRCREDVVESKYHVASAIEACSSLNTAVDEIMSQASQSKTNEILNKLSKLDSIATQINSLQDSVNNINKTVTDLRGEFHRLEEDVKTAVCTTNGLNNCVTALKKDVEEGKKNLEDLDKNTGRIRELAFAATQL